MLLALGPTTAGARLQPTNTGLTEWEWKPESRQWTLHSFNETSHLLAGERAPIGGRHRAMDR
jgi:hypothetical protein